MNDKIKLHKTLLTASILLGIAHAVTGCEDKKAVNIARQTQFYASRHAQVKKVADDSIASTNFQTDVRFEFAKIKQASPTYYIVCYSVTENGRNYQAGFHVMLRDNKWVLVEVTTNWESL